MNRATHKVAEQVVCNFIKIGVALKSTSCINFEIKILYTKYGSMTKVGKRIKAAPELFAKRIPF